MLKYPSRPSELCIFRENFFSADYVRDNGGTLVGSPTVANGITLNGTTQYATYPTTGFALNGKTALTFEMWFTPTFEEDDGLDHTIWDMSVGAGSRCSFSKAAANTIVINMGGTTLTLIALATYQAYWNTNKPNHFVVCAVTGSTLVYLNNNLIGTLATAWAQTVQPATLYLGATYVATNKAAGTIHSFSIYATKWDANEVSDAYNKITFKEMAFSNAVVHLPCKSIYADTGDGVMLGTDMDMEAADTSAWTATNNATLTKSTASPHGGTNALRIAYNGTNNPSATQAILTVGKTYRITGYLRGDGTAIPRFIIGGSGANVIGTASTTWQSFDYTGVCAGTGLLFIWSSATAAGWIEADDITIQEVDFLTENLGTGSDVKVGDSGLYGVTLAQNNGFVYDGANSYLDCGSDVVGTSAATFAVLAQVIGFGEGSLGSLFINGKTLNRLYGANANVYLYSNGVSAAASAVSSISLGSWVSIITTRTSTGVANFYINGQLNGTANQASGAPEAGTTNLIIGNNAARSNSFNGTIKWPTIWLNTVFTPTQVRELHAKLYAMINK